MSLAELSIKRPIFITCIIIVMIVVGIMSFKSLPVDQMPDANLPTVSVSVDYPGAGPEEVETLITKPLEDEIGTISGLKKVTSKSFEGVSQVTAEFQLKVDVKAAEQQVRDKVATAKTKFPSNSGITEPTIRRLDLSDAPIITLALQANLPAQKLFDLADQQIKMQLEQVDNVGQVQVMGGRKREIQVQLDRTKLKDRNFSVIQVSNQLEAAGEDVPGGKVNRGNVETTFRSIGEFRNVADVANTLISLESNEVPTKISNLGTVQDTLEDETSRVFVSGKPSLFLNVYKQSGSNTLEVIEGIKDKMQALKIQFKTMEGSPSLEVVQDNSKAIRDNVDDVEETIIIGIILTVFVVFFFLGSGRSTIITGLALPNSLIGSFIIMSMAGFTINVISLLALTLAVGLLIDDAIVVRENIFRQMEEGEDPVTAAKLGTSEVQLAVIATTAVVIAVFAPVGFMSGIIGQFLRQFGLTICFAMMISLFDALTIAPMLSAYLAEPPRHDGAKKGIFAKLTSPFLDAFNNAQGFIEKYYEKLLRVILKHPILTLVASVLVFLACMSVAGKIPFVFIPDQDSGEVTLDLDLTPGASLDAMNTVAAKADDIIRSHKEVALTTLTVGGTNGEAYKANLYIKLVPKKLRKLSTPLFKEELRKQLLADDLVKNGNPQLKNYSGNGPTQADLTMNLLGSNQKEIDDYSARIVEAMKKHPEFYDVDTSYRPGKPEFQVSLKPVATSVYGVNTKTFGAEIRAQVEGTTPAKFRENGTEYNIRVRLKPDQRDLESNFGKIFVPNINNRLVRLSDVADGKSTGGAAVIDRTSRARYTQINSQIKKGIGTNDALKVVDLILADEVKLPPQLRVQYEGATENFKDMQVSFLTSMGLGIMFIYLVLASLYESFITPFTIMLALPLAICGAFVAIFLAHEVMSFFALLGIVMLLGVACKNSILLVDTTNQLMEKGMIRSEALVTAGKTRLRPILMTSIALIMGTVPVAIGLNEASAQRTSMGWAIIGGVISSTLLTLLVIPAAFTYIDLFRIWSGKILKRVFAPSHGGMEK